MAAEVATTSTAGTFSVAAAAGRRVAVEPVRPGTTEVFLWGHALTATTCSRLSPAKARALGAHLMHCADAIDGGAGGGRG